MTGCQAQISQDRRNMDDFNVSVYENVKGMVEILKEGEGKEVRVGTVLNATRRTVET